MDSDSQLEVILGCAQGQTLSTRRQDERGNTDPRDELKGYLASRRPTTCSSGGFLRAMARDYLPIQGSSTAAEQVFQALQLLKSAYRNGRISAAKDAAQHMDTLIAELEGFRRMLRRWISTMTSI
ncbi:hypothetical protein GGX14DRAFT_408663 [Mycena pura]|uniref:Uncharacterized protein n=1 Tax=Mycena pura TaxID=153505 RepID=A0AAD6UL41_9AGAR|nr:hypothetical protein GGX14DRAFT_408663 [Mycena pura]